MISHMKFFSSINKAKGNCALVLSSLRLDSVVQQFGNCQGHWTIFDNGQGKAGLQWGDEPRAPPPRSEDSLPRLAELTATKADAPHMR